MITKYKYKSDLPYSLHDMVIKKIKLSDDSIKLVFDGVLSVRRSLIPG